MTKHVTMTLIVLGLKEGSAGKVSTLVVEFDWLISTPLEALAAS
jgi:hypothetical protein